VTASEVEQKKRIRNSALLFGAIALTFFIGFIMMAVLRA
jgi:hypothetical protein